MAFKRRYKLDAGFLRGATAVAGDDQASSRRLWLQWRGQGDFTYKTLRLPIRHLPAAQSGLRLLHLSDFHLTALWDRAYQKLIDRTKADPPDLILFTGDFIDHKWDYRSSLPTLRQLVGSLKSVHGHYAILGNHDPDILLPYVARLGVRVLGQERVIASTDRGEVELIGLPGGDRRDLDRQFLRALPARVNGLPRIVLSHFPDLLAVTGNLDADLYLSGHTHGGQICLPNGWPPLTHDRMPRQLAKGTWKIGATWYSVSAGLGYASLLPMRVFCPAEVTEIVLNSESGFPPEPRE
jgi:predicted MPP superfamily phosphohydrolase